MTHLQTSSPLAPHDGRSHTLRMKPRSASVAADGLTDGGAQMAAWLSASADGRAESGALIAASHGRGTLRSVCEPNGIGWMVNREAGGGNCGLRHCTSGGTAAGLRHCAGVGVPPHGSAVAWHRHIRRLLAVQIKD